MESGTCCSRPILTHEKKKVRSNGCLSLVVAHASATCFDCLHRSPNCLLSLLIMCAAVSEEAASDILVGAQPRITVWNRARSSSSELVDTATARRQQREEDATRVGLQFPFWSERRGRGAPSVSMKWRDAVKAAIMHKPLPPDVTLDAPYWWQPGMPLLPPADCMAPVPLKRKRDMSAEPKTDPAETNELTCAYPTRRSCGSWTSTPIKREPHSYRRNHAQSQRPLLAARLPPCPARARHRIRPWRSMDAAVSTQLAAIIYLCDRFGISQDRLWNMD